MTWRGIETFPWQRWQAWNRTGSRSNPATCLEFVNEWAMKTQKIFFTLSNIPHHRSWCYLGILPIDRDFKMLTLRPRVRNWVLHNLTGLNLAFQHGTLINLPSYILQCLTWLANEMDFTPDLNWKNVARPATENSFCPANFGFVQLRHFFGLKSAQFQTFQSLLVEILDAGSMTWSCNVRMLCLDSAWIIKSMIWGIHARWLTLHNSFVH